VGLDAILETIRQAGQASVCAIETRAHEEVDRILAEGKTEAEALQQEAREAASRAVTADRARIIHLAKLEAMRIVGHAEQTIIDQALEQAQARLVAFRAAKEYPQLLRDLVEEALEALQGSLRENEPIHLYADPRDRPLLDHILSDISQDIHVFYELEIWGGIRATSDDQRVVVDNTLEARLSFVTPVLQRILPALIKHDTGSGPAIREINTQSSTL
jgi:vacuolar-type H+-ATPase subunit E/Vma4